MIITAKKYNTKPFPAQRIMLKDYLDELNERYLTYRAEWENLDMRYKKEEENWNKEIRRGWKIGKEQANAHKKHNEKMKALIKEFEELKKISEEGFDEVLQEADEMFGKYNRVTGNKIDLQTVELLKCDILADDEISGLIDDFKDNTAMLRIIAKYAKERSKKTTNSNIGRELSLLALQYENAKFNYREPLENYAGVALNALSKDSTKANVYNKVLTESTYPEAVEEVKDTFLTIADDGKTILEMSVKADNRFVDKEERTNADE